MKKLLLLLLVGFSIHTFAQTDSTFIRKIYDKALTNDNAYKNLHYLCKTIGNRISGSAQAQMAVQWGEKLMKSYHFDKVYLQEVMVPHWKRGTKEAAWIVNEKGKIAKLHLIALGGSVGTNGFIEGQIIEVKTIEELKALGKDKVAGKVVFFNQAFNQKLINTFEAYSNCYYQRGSGTNEAGKLGAKACIIRSLATPTDNYPHTGTMHYDKDANKIPGAAISTKDADKLTKWLKKGKVNLKIEMSCKILPDVKSYNVIGEMKGKDKKIITFGGHLDSWDVGEGANDDGSGLMHSIEALSILNKLGYHPNHTLRCVFFMNEENGNRGGKAYAKKAKENNETHICALESDAGSFLPLGFFVSGNNEQLAKVTQFKNLLANYNLYKFTKGESGVDIGPLKEEYPKMMQLGLAVNSQRYFNYHHSAADVFENVNKRELNLGVAAMATMIYLMDKTLP